jgi:hypothetical protein
MEIVDISLQVEVSEEEVALDLELAHLTGSCGTYARAGALKQGEGEKNHVANANIHHCRRVALKRMRTYEHGIAIAR